MIPIPQPPASAGTGDPADLLLVFPLCDEPGLDTLASLQEGLPLCQLAGVVCENAGHVYTQKQQAVAENLKDRNRLVNNESKQHTGVRDHISPKGHCAP